MNPYEKCPAFENQNFLLKLFDVADAPDLLLVYSDEKALPFFNSDNCNTDFHFTTLEQMKQYMEEIWQTAYAERGFVRWTVIDRHTNQAIGTIELFNRRSDDYFNNCGLLRLDLRSDYERAETIYEILSLIIEPAFNLFECEMIATKVPPFAAGRKTAVKKSGFSASEEKLIGGQDQKVYSDYYVLHRRISQASI